MSWLWLHCSLNHSSATTYHHYILEICSLSRSVIRHCIVESFCIIASGDCFFPHRHKNSRQQRVFWKHFFAIQKKKKTLFVQGCSQNKHTRHCFTAVTMTYENHNGIQVCETKRSQWSVRWTACHQDTATGHSFSFKSGMGPLLIRYSFIYPLVARSGFGISQWKSKKKTKKQGMCQTIFPIFGNHDSMW